MSLPVKVRRLRAHPDPLPLPRYETAHAAGLDLRADIAEELILAPLDRVVVPTGLCVELPLGFEAQVRSRSGLAFKHGVFCLNAPGTVDADYRGEVRVLLANLSKEPFRIRRGDRIAQLVVARVERVELEEADALSSTARGEAGFGSTGEG